MAMVPYADPEIMEDLEFRLLALLNGVNRETYASLTNAEKLDKLFWLQYKYYDFLVRRRTECGVPVPKRWQRWYDARKAYSDSIAK